MVKGLAQRRLIVALTTLTFLMACHSGGSTELLSPSSGGTTSAGATSPDGSSVSAVDDQGFSYQLKATGPPEAKTQVVVDYGSITHDAPPGTEFVTVTLEVTNASDRSEPLPIDPSCCFSVFHLGVPLAIGADFDALDINGDCNMTLADGVCDVFTEVDSVVPSQQFELTPQIQAGDTVTLVLSTLNEVPSTVPLGSVELFFTHPISGDPAAQIPIPSG